MLVAKCGFYPNHRLLRARLIRAKLIRAKLIRAQLIRAKLIPAGRKLCVAYRLYHGPAQLYP